MKHELTRRDFLKAAGAGAAGLAAAGMLGGMAFAEGEEGSPAFEEKVCRHRQRSRSD